MCGLDVNTSVSIGTAVDNETDLDKKLVQTLILYDFAVCYNHFCSFV